MCLVGLAALWNRCRPAERLALAGGVLMGLTASVLSQSRGRRTRTTGLEANWNLEKAGAGEGAQGPQVRA